MSYKAGEIWGESHIGKTPEKGQKKKGSGLASVLQATGQSKYGFKFKNTRLSFTFGHDGLASIQDNR